MSVYTHVLYLVEDCLVVAGHVDHHGLLHTHLLSISTTTTTLFYSIPCLQWNGNLIKREYNTLLILNCSHSSKTAC